MGRSRAFGVGLVAVGVMGILLYGWLVFFSPWRIFKLQLTAFMAAQAERYNRSQNPASPAPATTAQPQPPLRRDTV
jgi:hypothetical protein